MRIVKSKVSKILIKWGMPIRQVAINEIIRAFKDKIIDSIPEEHIADVANPYSSGNIDGRNSMRKEVINIIEKI